MGLQLFTVRDAMAKDVRGTLKIGKDLGYEDLETYGFDPDNVGTMVSRRQHSKTSGSAWTNDQQWCYDLFRFLNRDERQHETLRRPMY